jgi:hypothetical protein
MAARTSLEVGWQRPYRARRLPCGEERLDPRQHIQVGHSDLPLEAAGEAAITTVINDPVAVATAALIVQVPD